MWANLNAHVDYTVPKQNVSLVGGDMGFRVSSVIYNIGGWFRPYELHSRICDANRRAGRYNNDSMQLNQKMLTEIIASISERPTCSDDIRIFTEALLWLQIEEDYANKYISYEFHES
jgi:hypothetical protein